VNDDIRSLNEILESTLREGPLSRGLREQEVLSGWAEIVGEEIARHSEPLALRDAILWVRVDGSAWAQELSLLKPRIRERLEERLGEGSIEDIRFHTGSPTPPQ